MIRVGIVGLGFMAATHIKAYRQIPGVQLAAICNPSGRNLDGDFSRVSGNVGGPDTVQLDMSGIAAYRNVEDFLANSAVDLVDICAPTPAHLPLVTQSLRAGKHVLCEKPLARNSEQARLMVAEAAQAGKFLMPAMCMRFWPEWAWLKKQIAARTYGAVLSARFRRVAEPPAWGQQIFFNGKLSGGALLDLHVHDVDFVHYCFGKPRAVYSSGHTKLSGEIDHVVTQYRFAGGPVVAAEGGWAMSAGFGFSMSYTVNFENATADYDLGRGAEALRLFQSGAKPETVACAGKDGYVGELQYIVSCLEKDAAPAVVTAQDGIVALEICEAESESVRGGKEVRLDG